MPQHVRETYQVFPKLTQPFWTWLTGKPLNDEQPVFIPSVWLYLAISVSIFAFGAIFGIVSLSNSQVSVFWLFLTIPATVLGARLMVLTIAHQCAHLMFCKSKSLNEIVHDVLTTLVCSQNYDSYRYDHFHVHHGIKTFGTFDDPVLSFIRRLGFLENMSKKRLWAQLIWTCVSPKFHGQYILNRLRYNFLSGRIQRRVFAVFWWGGHIVVFLAFPSYLVPALIAYIIPITVLYNISAFLELICEHVWMRPIGGAMGRERITELSWGRFCGDPVPRKGDGPTKWIRWTLRMTLYHFPCRVLVLTGDAPQHDFHHFSPNTRDWVLSAYARRDFIRKGKMEDREIWGLIKAIDIVFEQISTVSADRDSREYLLRSGSNSKPQNIMAVAE